MWAYPGKKLKRKIMNQTKVLLAPSVRFEMKNLSEQLQEIEQEITERIRAEYHEQTKDFRAQKAKLWDLDVCFRDSAKHIIKQTPVGTLIKVSCTRPDAKPQYYVGTLMNNNTNVFCIKISEGSEKHSLRSIGFSCLESLEILPQ